MLVHNNIYRFDRWIVGISGILFAASVILLTDSRYFFRVGPPLQNQEVIAQVTRAESDVRRRRESELAWLDLRNREDLFQADSVYTGDRSDVHIKFLNGTEFSIDPNSLVRLTTDFGLTHLDLKLGGLSGFLGPNTTLNISSGGVIRKITGNHTRFHMVPTSEGALQIAVLSGQALVSTKNENLNVDTNQQVQLSADDKITPIQPYIQPKSTPVEPVVPPQLLNPSPGNQYFLEIQDQDERVESPLGTPVELRWQDEAQAEKYEVQVSREPQFLTPLYSNEVSDFKIQTEKLSIGQYFWRVRVITPRNEKLSWSKSSSFEILGRYFAPAPIVSADSNPSRQSISAKDSQIKFNWKVVSGAKQYRIEVSSDPSFSRNSLKESKLVDQTQTELVLPRGTYYWRVRAINHEGWTTDYSSGLKLELFEKSLLPPPEVPKDQSDYELHSNRAVLRQWMVSILDFFIPTALAEESVGGPILKWAPIIGARSYRLEISNSPEFTKVIFKTEVKMSEYSWDAKSPGTYYWRVAAVDSDGDVGQMSKTVPLRVSVVPASSTSPKEIVERFSDEVAFEKYPSELELTWSPVPHAKFYLVQVGPELGLKKPLEFESTETKVNVPVFKRGTFYWRIRALNQNRQPIGRYSKTIAMHYDRILEKSVVQKLDTMVAAQAFNTNAKPPLGLQVLLGLSDRSYLETDNPDITEISIDAKLKYEQPCFGASWRSISDTHFTLIPLTVDTNTVSAPSMRLIEVDTNMAYIPQWFTTPWELMLMGGIFYETTIVSANDYGFHHLFGPELALSLRRTLPTGNSIRGYSRYSWSTQVDQVHTDIGFGLEWAHSRHEGLPVVISLDYSKISVNFSNRLFIETSALTLSSGTNW